MTSPSQSVVDKYAAAIGQTQEGQFNPDSLVITAGDAMRPADVMSIPGNISHNPPICPKCKAAYNADVWLYPFSTNPQGDTLFQCLNGVGLNVCGYECVFRVGTREFVQRPGRDDADWASPSRRYNRQPVPAEIAPVIETPAGFLTIRDAAEQIGVDAHDLAAKIAEGRIPVERREGRVFIDEAVVVTLKHAVDEQQALAGKGTTEESA
jgi:hypothetical protein